MTHFILRSRQAGKTTELIKMADNHDGYIVCHDRNAAKNTFELAKKLGATINFPLTFEDLRKMQYHAKGVRKIYIDNLDLLLPHLAPDVEIDACTINDA